MDGAAFIPFLSDSRFFFFFLLLCIFPQNKNSVNRFEADKALFVSFCCTILDKRIVRETLTESKELNCVDGWCHSNFFRRTFHVGGNHFDNDGQRARLVPLKSAVPIQVWKRPATLKPHKYFNNYWFNLLKINYSFICTFHLELLWCLRVF